MNKKVSFYLSFSKTRQSLAKIIQEVMRAIRKLSPVFVKEKRFAIPFLLIFFMDNYWGRSLDLVVMIKRHFYSVLIFHNLMVGLLRLIPLHDLFVLNTVKVG